MKISLIKRIKVANLLKNPDNFVLYRGSKGWTLDLQITDKELIDWLISICKTSNIKGKKNGRKKSV